MQELCISHGATEIFGQLTDCCSEPWPADPERLSTNSVNECGGWFLFSRT